MDILTQISFPSTCRDCGKCCSHESAYWVDLTPIDTIPNHMTHIKYDGSYWMRMQNNKCIAQLPDNSCSIYENRPIVCKSFAYGSIDCCVILGSHKKLITQDILTKLATCSTIEYINTFNKFINSAFTAYNKFFDNVSGFEAWQNTVGIPEQLQLKNREINKKESNKMSNEIIEPGTICMIKSGGPKMTALRISEKDLECWDFIFFYPDSHGPVEPKILRSIPGECVVVVNDTPCDCEPEAINKPSSLMHYTSR
jgi:Fe-S-cluster containining protein